MPLTLSEIAADPQTLTSSPDLPGDLTGTLRPLLPQDRVHLRDFYDGLSPRTRGFYDIPSEVSSLAEEHCSAIAKYDKLRLVLVLTDGFGGIFEFSLDLVHSDIERYRDQGITLKPRSDIRYGLCIRDDLQGRGVAASIQPEVNRIAQLLGANRLILWGGVLATNPQAIAFYERCGFTKAGPFVDPVGRNSIDMWLSLTTS